MAAVIRPLYGLGLLVGWYMTLQYGSTAALVGMGLFSIPLLVILSTTMKFSDEKSTKGVVRILYGFGLFVAWFLVLGTQSLVMLGVAIGLSLPAILILFKYAAGSVKAQADYLEKD